VADATGRLEARSPGEDASLDSSVLADGPGDSAAIDAAVAKATSTAYAPYPWTDAGTPTVWAISIATNDLLLDPLRHLLYATVPGTAVSIGNSVITVDPSRSKISGPPFVGSNPNALAISDDANTLYVGVDGAADVLEDEHDQRRFGNLSENAQPTIAFRAGEHVDLKRALQKGGPVDARGGCEKAAAEQSVPVATTPTAATPPAATTTPHG
jgi:hypothetical protein